MLADWYARAPSPPHRLVSAGLAVAPAGGPRSRVQVARRFAHTARLGLPAAYPSWVSFGTPPRVLRPLDGGGDAAAVGHRRVRYQSAGAAGPDRLLDLKPRTR